MAETYKPTEAMAAAAKRGLAMREKQPPSNRGGTAVGLARANQLVKRENLSLDTVKRMYSFFSRHEVDKKSDSWKKGNSKGEQAWLLWGGDAGYTWSRRIVKSLENNVSRELFQYNQAVSDDMVRRENVDGADCIVIRSATLPDNVVMNGGLYPAEEIEKSFASLERVLAPVGHPKKNGKFISATDPYAVHNFDVGAYVANVKRENGKVYHDTIINIEVASRTEKGRALLRAIENMEKKGELIHTSTGVLLEREPADGPNYSWIARNMAFDHNAILLNEPGAATPEQGVGLMVNAAEVDMETFAGEETSLSERYDMLKSALEELVYEADQPNECEVEDIYPDSGEFVYEVEFDGKPEEYRRRSFSLDENGAVTIGDTFTAVEKKRVWKVNKLLRKALNALGFAPSVYQEYNGNVNNETSDEDIDMTKEEMQALLDAQAEKMQANFKQELATLTAKVETLEANVQAEAQAKADAEKAERETLEANAKAKGFSDDVIAGMATNSLKAVLGQDKPAATHATGGALETNGEKDAWADYDLNANMEAK